MNQISTGNLNLIPNPIKLQSICKSISALEVIICPEWEFRYYSYQRDWCEDEEVFEMRNGEGDQMLILFSNNGTCINGFAHKSKMNCWRDIKRHQKRSIIDKVFGRKKSLITKLMHEAPTGVLDGLPGIFEDFIFGEPIKSIGTTFCIWQTNSDIEWKTGQIEWPEYNYKDGSSELLQVLDGNPLSYKKWADEYYVEYFEERFEDNKIKLNLVEEIYNHTVLTVELVNSINPKLENIERLKSDLQRIGYEHKL